MEQESERGDFHRQHIQLQRIKQGHNEGPGSLICLSPQEFNGLSRREKGEMLHQHTILIREEHKEVPSNLIPSTHKTVAFECRRKGINMHEKRAIYSWVFLKYAETRLHFIDHPSHLDTLLRHSTEDGVAEDRTVHCNAENAFPLKIQSSHCLGTLDEILTHKHEAVLSMDNLPVTNAVLPNYIRAVATSTTENDDELTSASFEEAGVVSRLHNQPFGGHTVTTVLTGYKMWNIYLGGNVKTTGSDVMAQPPDFLAWAADSSKWTGVIVIPGDVIIQRSDTLLSTSALAATLCLTSHVLFPHCLDILPQSMVNDHLHGADLCHHSHPAAHNQYHWGLTLCRQHRYLDVQKRLYRLVQRLVAVLDACKTDGPQPTYISEFIAQLEVDGELPNASNLAALMISAIKSRDLVPQACVRASHQRSHVWPLDFVSHRKEVERVVEDVVDIFRASTPDPQYRFIEEYEIRLKALEDVLRGVDPNTRQLDYLEDSNRTFYNNLEEKVLLTKKYGFYDIRGPHYSIEGLRRKKTVSKAEVLPQMPTDIWFGQ